MSHNAEKDVRKGRSFPTNTKVCKYFHQKGFCRRGNSCTYRHISTTASASLRASDTTKDRVRPVCKFYRKGECKNGPGCKFSHNISEPCFFYNDHRFFDGERCDKEENCKFSHSKITRQDFADYLKREVPKLSMQRKHGGRKSASVDKALDARLATLEGLLKSSQNTVKTLQETQEKLLVAQKNEIKSQDPKNAEPTESKEATETTVSWEWQNEHGRWVAYEKPVQTELEHLHTIKKSQISAVLAVKPKNCKFSYEVDVVNMTQTNTKSGTARQVRRNCRPVNQLKGNLPVFKRFCIENEAEVKQFVVDAHVSGGHYPHHTVSSVLKVLRSDVDYEAPSHQRDEKVLFHATSIDVCVKIQQGEFVPSSTGLLGAGVYLAPSPQKAWGYRKGNINCMLLCLVNTENAQTRGSGAMFEYCVDSPHKCLPLYIVIFD